MLAPFCAERRRRAVQPCRRRSRSCTPLLAGDDLHRVAREVDRQLRERFATERQTLPDRDGITSQQNVCGAFRRQPECCRRRRRVSRRNRCRWAGRRVTRRSADGSERISDWCAAMPRNRSIRSSETTRAAPDATCSGRSRQASRTMRQQHHRSVDVSIEHSITLRNFRDQRIDAEIGMAQRAAQIDVDAELLRSAESRQPRVQLVVQLLIGRRDAERIESRVAHEPVGDRRSPTHRTRFARPSSATSSTRVRASPSDFVSSVTTARCRNTSMCTTRLGEGCSDARRQRGVDESGHGDVRPRLRCRAAVRVVRSRSCRGWR